MTEEAACNAAFRRHHMGRLLHRMGALLPRWLDGPALVLECRGLERLCWRDLGYPQHPLFDGDVPPFLMASADDQPYSLSIPAEPAGLAVRMAALEPSPPPAVSRIGANIATLERLLNLTHCECRWLLWSYCVKRFGLAILPAIPLRDQIQGCEVLALLCETPVGSVQCAVESRRLHTWGFLDGRGTNGAMPSMLSGWLLATDQFSDWIEQPYASDSDLLTALSQAHVSLMASR